MLPGNVDIYWNSATAFPNINTISLEPPVLYEYLVDVFFVIPCEIFPPGVEPDMGHINGALTGTRTRMIGLEGRDSIQLNYERFGEKGWIRTNDEG